MVDASTTGWSGTTLVLIAGAATVLGWLSGKKSGTRTEGKRWKDGLTKTAKTGCPTGSSLNEDERHSLLMALSAKAEAMGLDGEMTSRLQRAAKDLIARAGIYREVKPKASESEAILREAQAG